jgi:SAM-dependent methyltransferase
MENSFDFDTIWAEEKPFADRLAIWIYRVLKPISVSDIGCGPGMFVESLRDLGVQAQGFDIDPIVIGKKHLQQKSMFDLTYSSEIVLCLEVAEHIDSSFNEEIVKSLYRNVEQGGWLIFSAAHPGQGGVDHINCQPKEYWEGMLTKLGFVRDHDTEKFMMEYVKGGYHMGWFAMNGMIFRKQFDTKMKLFSRGV